MVEPSGPAAPVSSRDSSRSASFRASSGRSVSRDPLAVARDLVGLAVLAELLADGVELPAQDELALALLHPLGDVVADPALQLDLAEHVARPGGRLLQPLADVERLEQLELLPEREVGREAGRVGQRTRLLDGPQEGDHAAAVAGLEDGLDDGAVGAHLLGQLLGDLGRVGPLGDVDPERAAGCVGAAQLGAVERPQRDPAVAAGQEDGLALHVGDDADPREPAVDLRHEHDLAVRADLVDRDVGVGGDELEHEGHAGEDDAVLERNQGERPGIRHESAFD